VQKGPLFNYLIIVGVMLERSEASWVGWTVTFLPFYTLVNTACKITFEETTGRELAGGEGFEPPLMDSESTVLPLDYPPVT
jgi:hypothetical protein